MDLVSVIIPVYNVEIYLRECLQSVIGQTYKNLEILLIDDGATDNSGKICDEIAKEDQRIKVFHRENEGVSAARNFGIEQASGGWIFFVDSDDLLMQNTIELSMQYVKPEDDICFIGLKSFNDNEDVKIKKISIENIAKSIKRIEKQDFRGLQFRIFNRDRAAVCDRSLIKLSSPCKLFRKNLIDSNQIRFEKDLPNGEDGVFNLYAYRYAKHGVAIEVPLYYYRQRADSVTNRYTQNVESDFKKLHLAYKKFIQSDESNPEFEQVWDERLIWSLSFCCILKFCHPDNSEHYLKRRKEFLTLLKQEYKDEVEKVSLASFTIQKKIIFWAIKNRLFLIIDLLCRINYRRK